MNRENRILFSLLRSAICGDHMKEEEKFEISAEILKSILATAKKHDVLHLVVFALKSNGIGSCDISALENEILKAAYRFRQSEHELSQICEAFEDDKIPFVTLKGAVIRKLYPEAWMRTSCDIDILVKEEDIDRSINSLTSRGYSFKSRNFHDVSLFSPSGVHLELHHSILENTDEIDIVLKDAWKYTERKTAFRHEFTKEFFLFHQLAHLYYHFVSGGCGIRPLIDIYLIKKQLGITISDSKELLEKATIYKFSEKIFDISEALFSGKDLDANQELVLSYIIKGGVYGTQDNKAAVKKSNKENLVTYSFKLLFLPYRVMKQKHPVLKKAPILLPWFYIKRIFSLLGSKRKNASNEINAMVNVKEEDISYFKILSEYLNI